MQMFSRREFMATGLAGAALASSGFGARRALAESDPWKEEFDQALARDPSLLGWQGVSVDRLETPALEIEGHLPDELVGTFYRLGPGRHERSGKRYHHWFDADGMIQAFRFDGTGIGHLGRFVATEKLAAEEKAGRFLYPGFGTSLAGGLAVTSPDAMNPANINILSLGDELLALWEGGSAHRLTPDTLETIGPKVWSRQLTGVPFSAHYKVEPDGHIWNFGTASGQNLLVLYHIRPDGTLVRGEGVALPEAAFMPAMVHDFAITERHLVFVFSPITYDREAAGDGAFLDAFTWRPELGSRALVVSKDDWSVRRWYELPSGFSFHFGNAWEDASGVIRFDYCVAEDSTVLTETFREIMRGVKRPATGPTRFARVTLGPDGGVAKQEISDFAAEFPRIAPAVVGRRHRWLYSLVGQTGNGYLAAHGAFRKTSIARHDLESGALDTFSCGEDVIPEEHIFVAKPGSANEDEGWLIGTSLDTAAGVTRVSVFDARHVSAGPIAQGTLPYALPLGFHGQWRPA